MASKKVYSKRRYRQKRKVRRRSAPNPRSGLSVVRGPLPNRHKATLSYISHEVMNPGSNTLATVAFSANGLFDPYLSLGGHQPRGFDQMMLMFRKYTVIGSRIRVSFTAFSANVPYVVGVATREVGAPFESSLVNYMENGNVTYKPYATGVSIPTLTQSYSPRKFNSIKDTLDNGAFAGSIISNPEKGADWHVFVGSSIPVDDAPPLNILVEISYIVVFHDPISLTIS